jgi:hypothetical protein
MSVTYERQEDDNQEEQQCIERDQEDKIELQSFAIGSIFYEV